MLLEQILKTKGYEVVTLGADATLEAAARCLDGERIGAVVVIGAEDEIAGVLSERDVIRHIARSGAAALSMKVADAMTRDVITALPSERVDVCLERMTDRRIRHLPVMRDGALAGVVSIGDLVKWKIAEAEAEAESLKSYVSSG